MYITMAAIPYNLLERMRLMMPKHHGQIVSEDFAGDITLTMQFPVDQFDAFQFDLRALTAGKLQAEIIETKEMIVPL